MAKKNLTIDDLGSKIDSQGEDIRGLITRVDSQGENIDGLATRIDKLDSRFDKLDSRIDNLAEFMQVRFDDMDKGFKEVKLELHGINSRIDALEAKFDEKLSSLGRMVKEDIGAFGEEIYEARNRLDKLERKYLALRAAK